jgi:hypothetical protein
MSDFIRKKIVLVSFSSFFCKKGSTKNEIFIEREEDRSSFLFGRGRETQKERKKGRKQKKAKRENKHRERER